MALFAGNVFAEPRVVVVNREDATITVLRVQGASLRPLKTIAVGKTPREMCLAPDGKRVYVSNGDGNSISAVDLTKLEVVATITHPKLIFPEGCGVSPDGGEVWITSARGNCALVVETASNTITREIATGATPRRVMFNADGSTVFISNAKGNTVSVIDRKSGKVSKTLPMGHEPRQMTLSPDGKQLLVGNIEDDTIAFVDVKTLATEKVLGVTPSPQRMVYSKTGDMIYVLGRLRGELGFVSLRASGEFRRMIHSMPLMPSPWSMALSADGDFLYITSNGDDRISVLDLRLMKIAGTATAGKDLGDIVYVP